MTDRTQSVFTAGFVVGTLLSALGVGAWVLTNFASMTALIPALFGVLIIGFASVGRATDRERLGMYGIGALGALGVLGSLRAVSDILALVTGGDGDSAVAATSQGLMIVLGLVLVAVVARTAITDR